MAASAPSQRIVFVDGLRALAALYVTLHHAMLEVWPVNHLPSGTALLLTAWMLYGHYAVAVFIVVSGFCLMLSVVRAGGVLRDGAWAFYVRRARRILPPYYAAVVLSLVLIWLWIGHKTGTHWDSSLPVSLFGVIEHVLLLQNFWSQSQINHALWSIAVEWQIYLLFPVLVYSWRKIGPGLTVVWAVALGYFLALGFPLSRVREGSLHFLALFVLGMLAAQIAFGSEERWATLRRHTPWLALTVLLWAALFLCLFQIGWSHYGVQLDLLVGFASAALLAAASVHEHSWLHRALAWRPLVFIGAFSYSLYLIHAPLLQLVWQYAVHPLGLGKAGELLALIGIGIPVIVGCAYVFFLFCERPFIKSFRATSSHAAP